MALFSLNELNHFRVKLARNYKIVPFEFSKIIIDKRACLQALKLNVQLLHLLQFVDLNAFGLKPQSLGSTNDNDNDNDNEQ